jgi:hypothetical protein
MKSESRVTPTLKLCRITYSLAVHQPKFRKRSGVGSVLPAKILGHSQATTYSVRYMYARCKSTVFIPCAVASISVLLPVSISSRGVFFYEPGRQTKPLATVGRDTYASRPR